uniref:Uncharacterized protein n=1 Tax=Octopus bimaculoides TaxID=37653 RepID=A0A0L8HHB0_OCTBM
MRWTNFKKDGQTDFQQRRPCSGQAATFRIIIEQLPQWNTEERVTLWELLRHFGLPEKIIRLVRAAYERSTCQVVHEASLTQPFTVLKGVRRMYLQFSFLFLSG